jgi:hypothetical protein
VVDSALACHKEVMGSNPNWFEIFFLSNRAFGSTQLQMGTRAIWEAKAACVMLTTLPEECAVVYKKYGH